MKNTNIEIALEVLKDEVSGNVKSALEKTDEDFSVTYMYKNRKGKIFPSEKISDTDFDIEDVYSIADRSYEVKNYAENNMGEYDVVFVEFIERYTDPETKQYHQTPITIVLQMKDGKIVTNRHYCDNDISFENLTKDQIEEAYKGAQKSIIIE